MGEEGRFLELLRRPDLPPSDLERILRNPQARRYHAVRFALAAHRNTPRGEALSLVETLFWRDLGCLSADARVHPGVRRAADTQLLRRLPEMALGERADLARTAGRGTLAALRLDPEPRVIGALLDNRFSTEPDIVCAAGHTRARPEVLEVIAGHPRWSLRPGVRAALLQNRALPPAAAESLLARATEVEMAAFRDSPGVPSPLRALAERILARGRRQE